MREPKAGHIWESNSGPRSALYIIRDIDKQRVYMERICNNISHFDDFNIDTGLLYSCSEESWKFICDISSLIDKYNFILKEGQRIDVNKINNIIL